MLGKTYLLDQRLKFVKELNIFIIAEDLAKVTDILRKHNVGGIAVSEIQGAGRIKRKELRERDGWSVKTVTPEYEARTKVETIVTDSSANEIIDDLVSSIGSQNEPHGVIFVNDVSNAHEIGTKLSGDAILTQR